MKLYEIPFAIRSALDSVEVDEDTGEILGASDLDAIEGEAAEKIENSGLYIKEVMSEIDALKSESERLTLRKRYLEKKVERIKALMFPAVDALGGKVKGLKLTVSIGTSKSVELDDNALELLPSEFIRTKVEADKAAIGKALKEGAELPGARLIEKRSIRMR